MAFYNILTVENKVPDYSDQVRVNYFSSHSLYKHPESYTIPMYRTTYIVKDDEMEEKINELNRIIKRNKPFIANQCIKYDQNELKEKIKSLSSQSKNISKDIKTISKNLNRSILEE